MAWNEPGPGGRDPWNQNGNKGKDQGPPDLDAIFKRFKAKLSGGKGPGKPGQPSNLGPRLAGSAGIIAGVIALLWVASGFYTVDEQQQAAVFRIGAYAGTTDPGLHWHIPWPIESVEKVNITGVRSISDRAVMLTQDENIISVDLTVQYRARSAFDYLVSVEDPDQTLSQATKASVREVVGQNTMDTILTDGRQAIADKTKLLLQERLDEYKTGLVVNEVNLKQVQPPEPVQAAFQDAIRAREDLERQKNEAQADANARLPKARGAAARDLAEAAAYKDQVVAKAEGDAARFNSLLTEYHKAPQVTRDRLYLDAMQDVMSRSSKVLVDVTKGSPIINLPLDQLMKSNAAKAPEPDVPTVSSPETGVSRGTGSGDASRSRVR
jgi:membrane protease subunit HflK